MISGIYSITNVASGKLYYGSSVNMEQRKRQHWSALRNGKHKNPHLQAAWKKYGESAFEFYVVERLPSERLAAAEQRYLDQNHGGYNIGKFADVPARGMKRSAEQRARMSAAQKGKKLSAEHKALLSLRGRGRATAEETRAKLRVANSGKKLSGKTKRKLAAIGRSNWGNKKYRDQMLAAQSEGKNTEQGKRNYSSSSKSRWADPAYKAKMSERRKCMWANPEFKAKMLVIRQEQGKRHSGENWRDRPKKKELSSALQKSS